MNKNFLMQSKVWPSKAKLLLNYCSAQAGVLCHTARTQPTNTLHGKSKDQGRTLPLPHHVWECIVKQKHQMTVGLLDKDIQGEVLVTHSQLKTFDQTVYQIQALEDGKQAKSQLSQDESSISSQRSAYKQIQKPSSTDK
jgi:hypothetical protein